MQLPPHDVHQPQSLKELFSIRERYGEDAALYAGGTELLLAMKIRAVRYAHLLDVKHIPDLSGVSIKDGVLCIGAATTHREIETDNRVRKLLPELARLARRVANIRVRSVGTIGGNLAFGEPHADPPTFLQALGARVVLAGRDSVRKLLIEDFLIGAYETALNGHEVLVRIEAPLPEPEISMVYEKFQILERPTIGVAACGTVEDGTFHGPPVIVVGSVGETPTRIPTGDLDGRSVFDENVMADIGTTAAEVVDPVEDLSGGEEYKRHLTHTFVRRALHGIAQGRSQP